MTAADAAHRQDEAAPTAVTFDGRQGVARTRWVKAAVLAHPRAEEIPVATDYEGEDGTHGRRLSRFQCSSSSARNAWRVVVAADGLAITTISHPPKSPR